VYSSVQCLKPRTATKQHRQIVILVDRRHMMDLTLKPSSILPWNRPPQIWLTSRRTLPSLSTRSRPAWPPKQQVLSVQSFVAQC
jgi:hypothetical protein